MGNIIGMNKKACQLVVLNLFMIVVSGICNRAEFGEVLLFSSFFIGGMIIPGIAICKAFPIKEMTELEELLFGYIAGYILSIIIYVLSSCLNISDNFHITYIGVFIVSIIYLIKKGWKRETSENENSKKDFLWGVIILVLFVISLFVFSLKNAVPTFIESNNWHGDLLYWVGDSVSLTKEIPPRDFRSLDLRYSYHYFGALQLASMAKATGIAVVNIALRYSYIQAMTLIGLAAICFVRRISKNINVTLILFLLLFATGFEKITGVTWFWHIYQIPMSFNIAISLEMTIAILLMIQLQNSKIDFKNLFLLLVSLAICTGTKGPSGAIILCGIGIVCIYWLIKREYKKSFLFGLASLAVWGMVYFCLLKSGNSNYMESSGYVDPFKLSFTNPMIVNIKILFWKTIYYFRDYVLINPWTFIPAAIYSCYALIKRKMRCEDFAFLFMLGVGTILGYMLHYYGSSQIYFSLSTFPFAAALAGKFYELLFEKLEKLKWGLWYKKILVVVLFIGVIYCGLFWNWKNTLQIYLQRGAQVLMGISPEYDNITQMMTHDEYEAYLWIRDNTDTNSIFLTDRGIEETMLCYIPGVFSERYFWGGYNDVNEIERIKMCYEGHEDIVNYCKEKGIKYIVQNRRISKDFSLPQNKGRKIFDNNSIIVWCIDT